MNKVSIAVLCSGGGTNFAAIQSAAEAGLIPHGEIALVVSDHAEAYVLTRAARAGLETAVFDRKQYPDRDERESRLLGLLKSRGIGLVVLAGFLTILSGKFVSEYENRIINIHPALLPSFGGRGMYGLHVHEAVLRAGVKVTGATAHYVTAECDAGPIIAQRAVEVKEGDTPERLQKRVMREAEWVIFPRAVEEVCKKLSEGERSMSYEIATMEQRLKGNAYPGRGIVVGLSEDGRKAVFAYFIMGRSENSRNRVFAEYGDEVRAEPCDASKVKNPALIIYSPVKVVGKDTVVTNGDQTDTVERALRAGHCFRHGLMTRAFEPDPPLFTPRISAVLHFAGGFSYEMSILKSADEAGTACDRYFFAYEPVAGLGHFLHTYERDGNPPPVFSGEPERVRIPNDLHAFADEIWNSLDPSNKISLYCRAIDLATGAYEKVLINKYTR